MLLFEFSRRSVFFGLLPMVMACGFKPIYGKKEGATGLVALMGKVQVASASDRLGQTVRNNLLNDLIPYGVKSAPEYRLEFFLKKTEEGVAFERDDSVTRYNVILVATFKLTEISTGSTLAEGLVRSIAAYNVVRSEYATMSASRNAEERVAKAVSDEIQLRIALELRNYS
tara:strand:- start:6451 stop:6963 length:513 start_codon:yes stop_codon:yes gene_type:complete